MPLARTLGGLIVAAMTAGAGINPDAALTYSTVILFHSGQSTQDASTILQLQIVQKKALKHSDDKIAIFGHADYLGSTKLNLKLSSSRAEGVSDYLSSSGVPKEALRIYACGSNYATERGQNIWKDRRVEIYVGQINRIQEIEGGREKCRAL